MEREHGLNRQQFAALAGKRPEQITRYLSGPANMTLDTLSDLLLGLGMEPTFEGRRLVEEQAVAVEHAVEQAAVAAQQDTAVSTAPVVSQPHAEPPRPEVSIRLRDYIDKTRIQPDPDPSRHLQEHLRALGITETDLHRLFRNVRDQLAPHEETARAIAKAQADFMAQIQTPADAAIAKIVAEMTLPDSAAREQAEKVSEMVRRMYDSSFTRSSLISVPQREA